MQGPGFRTCGALGAVKVRIAHEEYRDYCSRARKDSLKGKGCVERGFC